MKNNFLKRIFSLTMVIMLVLSMLPTNVFAETVAQNTTVDTTDPNYCPHCNKVLAADEWLAWNATNVAAGGHYRLTSSFTLSSQVTIAVGADTVIDLAGFTITGKYPTTIATNTASGSTRLFWVKGELSVLDSTATTADGVYTSGALYGGYINNGATTQGGPKGGNVYVDAGATFNLYSGTVRGGRVRGGGQASHRFGGNVYGYPGSEINMYGGEISGGTIVQGSYLNSTNDWGYHGGCNIGSFGDVNIYGGTIKDGYLDNWTPDSNYRSNGIAGGNISVLAGTGLDG